MSTVILPNEKPTTQQRPQLRPGIVIIPKKNVVTRTECEHPHSVILHNDSINGFDYVMRVLQQVFGYSKNKAFWLTMRAHCFGRSNVWSGSLEVAELRAEQIVGCGPDPVMVVKGAQPLHVSIEQQE